MSRWWPSSLRARLTLWYTVFLALPLIALAFASYLAFARALEARTERFIGDALSVFAREVRSERRAELSATQAIQSTAGEVRFRDLHITVLDTAGRVVATTAPPDYGPTRVVSRGLDLNGERFALTGTYSLREIAAILQPIRDIFAVAIPLLILGAATSGFFLARRGLAPVAAMASHAAEISATNLHERLPVGGGDELVGLARVVNDLLDRLERSFIQQRRFVADASHELRTPTAILRSEADVTLSRPRRDEAEYRASIAVIQDAARRLGRIVDDLFLLARADSGHLAAQPEALYLEEIVLAAARAVRGVADQRDVRIELSRMIEAPFHGDPDLLGRLLLNLLDNAIKHSPAGASVDVAMSLRDGRYEITVTDAGPGIPSEARERIFERFFRLDAARSRAESSTTSGAGLGLAIARHIAVVHGGTLDLVESSPGRTRFRASLPADPASAERVVETAAAASGE